MNRVTIHPEPTQGEPHPAVRLAELVALIVTALCGGGWSLWRFLPGARAFRAQMQQMSRDFTALMHRLASLPPQPLIAQPLIQQPPIQQPASQPRATRPTRPDSARRPSRGQRASARKSPAPRASKPRAAFPPPPRAQAFTAFPPPAPEPPWPRGRSAGIPPRRLTS